MSQNNKEYKLFLDDFRTPRNCTLYMVHNLGKDSLLYEEEDWIVVKNYIEFCDMIILKGIPELVSFDHDLSPVHYRSDLSEKDLKNYYEQQDREMTGYDCAKWLCDYCEKHSIEFPKYYVHSMNPVGVLNIINYINNFKNRK